MLAVKNVSQAEILCIGSSHFQRAIDPRHYQRPVTNINHPGLNYIFAEQTLKTHLPSAQHVSLVVLEFGCTPLLRDTFQSTGLAAWQLGLKENLFLDRPLQLVRQFVPVCRSPKPDPAELMKNLWTDSTVGKLVPGYDGTTEVMVATGAERAIYHNSIYSVDHAEENRKAFARIIRFCRAHQLELKLLRLPCADGYYDTLQPALLAELADFRNQVDRSGVTLVDAQHWDWNTDDFRDGDHLNSNGAKKLSRDLQHIFAGLPPQVSSIPHSDPSTEEPR